MKTSRLRKGYSSKNFSNKFYEKSNVAFKSLYDKGTFYTRHEGQDSKTLDYVPQTKTPKFQQKIDEDYLKDKRKLDYSPQSQKKDVPTITLNQG
jgi:hypothetical protein